jgi:ankyrin repeat protein
MLTLAQAGQADELERLLVELAKPLQYLHVLRAVRLAAANGHAACVHLLLWQPTDRPNHLLLQRHALFTSAGHGHSECVRVLCGAKANVHDFAGPPYPIPTALGMAAFQGCTDTIRALLEANAQPDHHYTRRDRPVVVAADMGNDAAVLGLLEAGSPLPSLATAAGACSTSTLRVLLQAKADVNRAAPVCLRVTLQDASLWEGITTPLRAAIICGRADVVRVLCAADADVDARYRDEKTALELAQDCGHVDVVRALCDAKADPGA